MLLSFHPARRVGGVLLAAICLAAAACGQATSSAPASTPSTTTGGAPEAKAAAAPPAATPAQTAAKPSAVSTTAPLPQQIAALPRLANSGIDADARGKDILAHLNAVLRFYRESLSQAQKVGEPSDVLYGQQASGQAMQVGQVAFQSARNLAALLARLQPNGAAPPVAASADGSAGNSSAQQTDAQRLAAVRAQVQARIADLSAQDAALDKQISTAKAQDLPDLRQRDEELEGQLELQKAMLDALGKVSSMAGTQASTGLSGDVERLLQTAPELGNTGQASAAAPPALESLNEARDAGVSSKAVALFQLLSTRSEIDDRIHAVDSLRQQANDLRAPMLSLLRSTIQQGDAAMESPPNASDAEALAATRKRYDTLSATFRVLSTATLPLMQEVMLLQSSRSNLVSWRSAVEAEYSTILRSLLLRVLFIAVSLLVLFIVSQVWQRLTVKYVHDIRRRRQILILRRILLGFLSGVVVIFGFVTQFSSLATFAGFITAGIAVGLQTILLSVAAYFFIIGRYGVRVGDRITVAGVTGDVIEVGLVRFYMSELTGTGTELHPTGRVAVFANSVLFQAGTPLYKQMPGTEYAWHELSVLLKPDMDYKPATQTILNAVTTTYDSYRASIEEQHVRVEQWMDTALEAPHIEPRLQLTDAGLQYAVLFPVEIKDASATDEKIVHALLDSMANNEAVRSAIASPPTVRAVIKG